MPAPAPPPQVDPKTIEAVRKYEKLTPSRTLKFPYPGMRVVIDGPAVYEGCNGGTHYKPRWKILVNCKTCNQGFPETNIIVCGDNNPEKQMTIHGVNHLSYEASSTLYLWPCKTQEQYSSEMLEEWNKKISKGNRTNL